MTIKNTELAKLIDQALREQNFIVEIETILNGLDAERTPEQEETEELTADEIEDLIISHFEAIRCEIEEAELFAKTPREEKYDVYRTEETFDGEGLEGIMTIFYNGCHSILTIEEKQENLLLDFFMGSEEECEKILKRVQDLNFNVTGLKL